MWGAAFCAMSLNESLGMQNITKSDEDIASISLVARRLSLNM